MQDLAREIQAARVSPRGSVRAGRVAQVSSRRSGRAGQVVQVRSLNSGHEIGSLRSDRAASPRKAEMRVRLGEV